MDLADRLAALNAALNGASLLALLIGRRFIRLGDRRRHKIAMLTAFGISGLFLTSYLTRFALSGTHAFPAGNALRWVYLPMLATHVSLAATVPVLAVFAVVHALKERIAQHRKTVRWLYPIWLYVSVTGILVYLMLYSALGKIHL